MFDFTIEQLAMLNNIVDDEIFRKSSKRGYESYIEELEILMIDIENAFQAKKANIEKTKEISTKVEEEWNSVDYDEWEPGELGYR